MRSTQIDRTTAETKIEKHVPINKRISYILFQSTGFPPSGLLIY